VTKTLGFIGVGTVSTAVVHALCSRPGPSQEIVLSPRSTERSQHLADHYAQCTRVDSNQAVVDASDIVILSVLPQQAESVLAELTFRPEQIFVSFIGGAPPSEWVNSVGPITQICTAIPLPAIELHRGPMLVCPPIPEVMDAFTGLGDVVPWHDESTLRVFSVTTAIMSTYYEAANTVIDWSMSQGIDEATAATFVRSLLAGLAAVGQATEVSQRGQLPEEHETPGGLNARVRRGMTDAGAFGDLSRVLEDVYLNAVLR
jgi:pyrroline-5-carboxylate reductase